jgi:kumamolisin
MSAHFPLIGSDSSHPANSLPVAGPLALNQIVDITLVLRRSSENPTAECPTPLSRENFFKNHAVNLDDVDAVRAFANENRFSVSKICPEARSVTVSGELGKLAALFQADLRLSRIDDATYRTRTGTLHLPRRLRGRVVAVLGFDERPSSVTYRNFQPRSTAPHGYSPREIAKAYNFPTNIGAGQTIALIELGGGYRESDLKTYWKQVGVQDVKVSSIGVDGATNAPIGDPNSEDGEVVLDIEVAGAVAPGANIAVYFAPNTDAGFLAAVQAAIHDKVRNPSVISISWGAPESQWTEQSMNAFNAAFNDAALLGITVCVAAGDNGSSDGVGDKKNHVDFPASSPWVIACGGTRLVIKDGVIDSETTWNNGRNEGATGGGVSSYFPMPNYQAGVKIPKPTAGHNTGGRGIPDVAGVADPQTGYQVLVDGESSVVGGTSAVAPLWAGLIALCNEQLGKNLGWFNPTLYSTVAAHKVLNEVSQGTNGAFHASEGWDCCTGLGTPNGMALLDLLKTRLTKA